MIKYRESNISAHHNYLVNNMLTPGFVVGNPASTEHFYFLADIVLSGESTPRISARIMDQNGFLLTHLKWNRIYENPAKCVYKSIQGGFILMTSSGETLLKVATENFANGYLTSINTAELFDENRVLRIKPSGNGIYVSGEADLSLRSPFSFTIK